MKNYKIYSKVKMGRNCKIGDYVVIGLPPRGKRGGKLETIIGDNAFIRSHTVIYAGNRIGNNFQTGHQVMIRENNRIGNDVSIGTSTVLEHHIKVENRVRIHSLAFICEYSILEEGCWVGPKACFTNVLHPLCPKAKECIKGPIIKKRAKIGANATILPGVTIGKNSLIGAGSVVVKDVGPNKVVAGSPARVIKDIEDLKCPFNLMDKPYPEEL
ncbi:transferase [bacterium]|nr:transferase [bacterium]